MLGLSFIRRTTSSTGKATPSLTGPVSSKPNLNQLDNLTNLTEAKKRFPTKYIKILVDSQSALKALSNDSVKSETVQRTIRELSQLGYDLPRLTLAWIKAHAGYEGNKLADMTAK